MSADQVDRSKLPMPTSTTQWAPPEVQVHELSGGMKLWHLKQGQTPLVSLRLVLPRGAATDPPGKEGLTDFTADMLDEGAGKLSALEMSDELQRLATSYGVGAGTDAITFYMDMLVNNFDRSAELLADIVLRPKFPFQEFQRRKKERVTAALSNESQPRNVRMIVLRKVLYGDGYGGYSPNGDKQSLGRITHFDVKQQHKKLFVPEGAIFIAVGGIEAEAAKAGIEKAFGAWKGEAKGKARKVADKGKEGGIHFVDFPGTTQSAIAVARRAPGTDTDDFFPAAVYNRILGGAFTSRLNLNLREDKGYTYGARTAFLRWRHAGVLMATANVKAETTKASFDETLKELAGPCRNAPITETEIKEAVDGVLLGFPGRFERVSGTAGQLLSAAMDGHGASWLSDYPGKLGKVSQAQVTAMAKQHCGTDDVVMVVAGDKKTVAPTLEALGREIHYYDALGNPLK